MATRVSLDDQLFEQLQKSGEVRVEDARGVPIVLMTVDARERLRRTDCNEEEWDGGEWTVDEMRASAASWLDDPEGWGAPGMEAYDDLHGEKNPDNEGAG